jgi:glycogen operon protein
LPFLHLDAFYTGTSPGGVAEDSDIRWFEPDGREMHDAAWNDDVQRALAVLVSGPSLPEHRERLYLALNPGHGAVPFLLPAPRGMGAWRVVLDNGDEAGTTRGNVIPCGSVVEVPPGGLLAFEPESQTG